MGFYGVSMAHCIRPPLSQGPECEVITMCVRRLNPLLVLLLVFLALATAGLAHADGPVIGSEAPNFKLQDQNGAWHELKAYRGKWLALYFYPQDQLPSSTEVARDFSYNFPAFREAGATVVGISVDDVASHKKFATKNDLPFRILADPGKQTARAYGVLKSYPGAMELAKRDTFLIDPEGRVVKHYTDIDPKGHAALVLGEMKALSKKAE